ncbi:hypothetical protein JD969_19495 [Planctomycetota bacterium]|nr:hypothetical protein JD969_19495 [Planctomycetota bacterium]
MKNLLSLSVSALTAVFAFSSPAKANELAFDTSLSSQYFIITTDGSSNDASDGLTSVSISNYEIGANKAPVPSTDDFLIGGSSGGPTLLGSVPDIPLSGVAPVFQGIGGHANVAVTNSADQFNAQDVGVYADPDIGIQLAGSKSSDKNASGNSFFNDPNMFPNTFTPTGSTGVLGNQGGTGVFVNNGDAVQSTAIDYDGSPGNAGVTFNFDHSVLLSDLADTRNAINALPSTGILNVSNGNGGQFDNSTTLSGPASIASTPTPNTSTYDPSSDSRDFTITLSDGLNVIDFTTGGNDIKLDNSNLIINGSDESSVIFRFDDENFLVSNSNILLGDGGIGGGSVMFYTDQDSNDTLFGFNNTIINGAAFWSLGDGGGEISVQNGQGCTQFVADTVLLSDVRFTKCAYMIPEPSSLALIILSGVCMLKRHI